MGVTPPRGPVRGGEVGAGGRAGQSVGPPSAVLSGKIILGRCAPCGIFPENFVRLRPVARAILPP